jgi:hypothetical protein
METTHPDKTAPVGLTHFLAAHSSCDGDFDTLPGGTEVTLRCQGCGEHFTYNAHSNGSAGSNGFNGSNGHANGNGSANGNGDGAPSGFAALDGGARQWVAEQLSRIATPAEPVPAEKPSNGTTRREPAPRVGLTAATESRRPEPAPAPSPGPAQARPMTDAKPRRLSLRPSQEETSKRVPPPGPYAPKRQSNRARQIREELTSRLESLGRTVVRRWRPVVLSVLALAGAYMVLVLGSGDEPSSSQPTGIGGSDIPAAPVQIRPGTPAPKAVRKGTTAAQKAVELSRTPQPQPGSP